MTNNKNRFILSVQAKIILVAILLITLVLGAYAVIDIYRKQSLANIELQELADVAAKKLTENLRIPMWNLDSELVGASVEAEMLTKDIEAIFVLGTDDIGLVAAKLRQSSWKVAAADSDDINDFDGRIRAESYINYENENIGKVIVYVTQQFRVSALYESVLVLLSTLLFLDIVIFIVLFLVINKILKKPIDELCDAANQISRGDFNIEIEADRYDEIGVVAHSIDRMRISLKMSIDRLRKLSQQHKALIKKMEKDNG
jgi:HAMP domain-containing protein